MLESCAAPRAAQVITHLLHHLHPDAVALSCEAPTKTPASAWSAAPGRGKPDPDDALVVVRGGELLQGVLDKSAFGATEYDFAVRTDRRPTAALCRC
jgi:hypothetical protein